jgi:hypothetical protein
MSALGQKQTLDCRPLMSALPPKADIAEQKGVVIRPPHQPARAAYQVLREQDP